VKKVAGLIILLVIGLACKEMKNEVIQEKAAQDWITLFNGSSFDHWRGYLNDNMYSEWVIQDGVMAFTPGDQGGKNIITREKYTNFILSLEWKISEGGNSGIFWGVYENEKFPESYQTGPEVQVLDNERHPDSFLANGKRKAGAIYDIIAYPSEFVNPAGEWNLCVLDVDQTNNLGKVTMNSQETISFPLHGPEWDDLIRKSKFIDWEGFAKYPTGHIGLQDHGNKVWYRDIKIQNLDL
jgi:hypothetical protein